MSALEMIDKRELRELLNKCWMTHDAMWFVNCLEEFGIEKTNKINRAAVKDMAIIEANRMKKIFSIEKIDTFEEFKTFYKRGVEILTADFMDFIHTFPSENLLRWDVQSCFAYDGVNNIGVIDQYECGIFERIKGWLEALDIKYSIAPEVNGCMMHTDGRCYREFRLYF